MQRQLARLAELAPVHDEQAVGGVEVGVVEPNRLADPHASDRQQTDQGPVGRNPMRCAQCRRRHQQGGNLLLRVEVGCGPAWSPGQ